MNERRGRLSIALVCLAGSAGYGQVLCGKWLEYGLSLGGILHAPFSQVVIIGGAGLGVAFCLAYALMFLAWATEE